ncbi:amidohydrolase [Eubacteriaceae bacterium ES2]|nr:amidohydrolase [Eubacteriaceae bacterium ES2]
MIQMYRQSADIVIRNATIYTVALTIDEIKQGNYDFPVIKNGYVAVKDGKIISVSDKEIKELIDQETEIIEADGQVLIPGLVDSHTHAMFAGLDFGAKDLTGAQSKEALINLMLTQSKEQDSTEWICGREWNELIWSQAIMPTCKDLDRVSIEKPILCTRLCHHIYLVNSKALDLAGITKETPDPESGKIGRFEDGSPNGLFYEEGGLDLINKILPPVTVEDGVNAIEIIGKHLNSNGITSIIDANLCSMNIRSYFEAEKAGKLSYRANPMLLINPSETGDLEDYRKQIEDFVLRTGHGNDMVKLNGIKIMMDGIPAAGTAYMREPYEHMPDSCGFLTIKANEFLEAVKIGAKNNWQVGVHAIGTKAVDVALDAYQKAYCIPGVNDSRHYVIHANFPAQDQLPLMKMMDVGVAAQPTIFHLMGEENLLCDKNANLNSPCKLYMDHGIICAGSSDFPVIPCNPFLGMYAAITRIASDGKVWGEEHRITPNQALIMWTMNSAYLSNSEKKIGSIEIGKLADLTLIDTEILTCRTEEIKNTKVLKTITNGHVVYSL